MVRSGRRSRSKHDAVSAKVEGSETISTRCKGPPSTAYCGNVIDGSSRARRREEWNMRREAPAGETLALRFAPLGSLSVGREPPQAAKRREVHDTEVEGNICAR